jgi:hypothetical protein
VVDSLLAPCSSKVRVMNSFEGLVSQVRALSSEHIVEHQTERACIYNNAHHVTFLLSKHLTTPWYNRVIRKVTLSSPLSVGILAPPIPSFSGIHKVQDILLNLNMKFWNSAFHAQGSRLIIVVVQLGAVKIYVGAQEKRKDRMKLSLRPKLVVFWVSSALEC